MRTFFTTEENLIKILHSDDTNIWKRILNLHDVIFISSPTGMWNQNNKTLSNFHRTGKKLYCYNEFFDRIKSDSRCVLNLSQPTFLLNLDSDKTNEIMDDYGVCCYSIESDNTPFYTNMGWEIEANDIDFVDKSWKLFFAGLNKSCNSILVMDRYFFASQWNKDSGCPDDNLQDSYDNLASVLDNVLPDSITDETLVVSVLFDISTVVNSGKNKRIAPTFQDLAVKIEQIRQSINRSYKFHIELISVQNGCSFYSETHDRFIVTNYSITEATHKLKAFNNKGEVIDNQKLYFNYAYSRGITQNDKSSAPAKTQDRILSSIKQLLSDTNNYSKVLYALDGVVQTYDSGVLQNRLLVKV